MLIIPGRQIGSVGSCGGRKHHLNLGSPKQGAIWRPGLVVVTRAEVLKISETVWSVLKPRSGLARTEARLP